jgi:hypothetical protein
MRRGLSRFVTGLVALIGAAFFFAAKPATGQG